MAPNDDRWLVVQTTGALWLHEGQGAEARDRIVSRIELATAYPRLYAELVASDHKDCPRVVVER